MLGITNNDPASGCSASAADDRPVVAEVTYKSSNESPPNVQEVTRETGKAIRHNSFPE
jgi:hypothetical protein